MDQTENADPELVELVVKQPLACEIYYETCGLIDQHNRHRQDTLQLEKKIETKDWATRIGTTLFGMMIVDTWLVFKGATCSSESQQDFYTYLAEELIDNTYDQVGGASSTRTRSSTTTSPEIVNKATGAGKSGIYTHLTPTKRKRKTKDGVFTNHSLQGRCRMCGLKTRYVCSTCNDDLQVHHGETPNQTSAVQWICHTETDRMCFPEHVTEKHS